MYSHLRQVELSSRRMTPCCLHKYAKLMQWQLIKLATDISMDSLLTPEEIASIWLAWSGIKKCDSVNGSGKGCT